MTEESKDLKARARSVLGLNEVEFEDLLEVVGPDALGKFVAILDGLVIRERIPVVIRRQGDGWLDGRSLLEVFRAEGIESINRYIERLRAWIPE